MSIRRCASWWCPCRCPCRLPPLQLTAAAANAYGPPRCRFCCTATSRASVRLACRPSPGQFCPPSVASLPAAIAGLCSCRAGAAPRVPSRAAHVLAPCRRAAPLRTRQLPKQALHHSRLQPCRSCRRARAAARRPPPPVRLRTARAPSHLLLRRQSKTWQLPQSAPALLAADLHHPHERRRAATASPRLPLFTSAGSPKTWQLQLTAPALLPADVHRPRVPLRDHELPSASATASAAAAVRLVLPLLPANVSVPTPVPAPPAATTVNNVLPSASSAAATAAAALPVPPLLPKPATSTVAASVTAASSTLAIPATVSTSSPEAAVSSPTVTPTTTGIPHANACAAARLGISLSR
jgi:hypothetical protein